MIDETLPESEPRVAPNVSSNDSNYSDRMRFLEYFHRDDNPL
jgi:hypothetical protein